ncbi:MAG TPA: MutS family DNA mismatch repair protein [Thermoanaerobaculia bacterium]|nr:MutS family DNA mismatch repair protein [Thermoanaerobaculia bacterium]
MTVNTDSSAVEAVYRQRRADFTAEEKRLARRSLRISIARFAAFLVFALCLLAIVLEAGSPVLGWVAGAAVAFAVFVALVGIHERVIRAERRFGDLAAVNDEALRRMERDWPSLPLPRLHEDVPPPPEARDLNLLGRASLFHLLGTAHTPPGKAALAAWLLAPADPGEIVRRQAAVAELAPELDLRQQLEVSARPMEKVAPDTEPFLRWAEDRPWMGPALIWGARALAAATVGLGIAAVFGLPGVLAWSPALLVGINLALSQAYAKRMSHTFNRISSREGEFQLYATALALLDGRRFASPRLVDIEKELAAGGLPAHRAHRAMDLLHRRVVLSDSRHSALLHLPLQLLLLWDFHVLWLLERWQRDFGGQARRWLAALGDFEALAALAGLRHDNPGWAFPEVAPREPALFAARELGHPLLPAKTRVGNDVTLGPPGTFLLVTGSNMSGKSTLLRAIGANAVLAQAGGPVCAAALSLPPLTLATSILVEDSLADGVSFFLAELQRIRRVVDAAERAGAEGRTLLYLLDEVLRGTNSEERQIAVKRVLVHLLSRGALGAVSTHDTALAGIPELLAACRPVHFRESFTAGPEGTVMTFDYKMRSGVATTVNALKLLDLVGLGAEGAEAPIVGLRGVEETTPRVL